MARCNRIDAHTCPYIMAPATCLTLLDSTKPCRAAFAVTTSSGVRGRGGRRGTNVIIFCPTAMKPTFAKAVTARIGFCGTSVIENKCFGILPRRRQVSSGSSNAGDANTSGMTRGRCGTLDISLHSRCGGKVTSCDYRTSRRDTQTVVAALLVLDVLGMVFVADAREPILSTFK